MKKASDDLTKSLEKDFERKGVEPWKGHTNKKIRKSEGYNFTSTKPVFKKKFKPKRTGPVTLDDLPEPKTLPEENVKLKSDDNLYSTKKMRKSGVSKDDMKKASDDLTKSLEKDFERERELNLGKDIQIKRFRKSEGYNFTSTKPVFKKKFKPKRTGPVTLDDLPEPKTLSEENVKLKSDDKPYSTKKMRKSGVSKDDMKKASDDLTKSLEKDFERKGVEPWRRTYK